MGGREGEHCVAAWADLSLLAPLFGGRLISSPHAPLLSTRRPLSPRGEGERERERVFGSQKVLWEESRSVILKEQQQREQLRRNLSEKPPELRALRSANTPSGCSTHPTAAPIPQQHPSHSSTHPTAAPV